MSHKKKHKVLEILNSYFDNKSQEAMNYTELGKSMSYEQLHSETGYKLSDIKSICSSLEQSNHICPITYTQEPNVQRYYINSLGKSALFDKYFLSSLWYRDTKFLIPLILSFLVGLASILIALLPDKEIEPLEKRIQQLEQKSDSLQIRLQKIQSTQQSQMSTKES